MTIKKIKPAKPASAPASPVAAPATGGATIADRFKLDAPDQSNSKAGSVGKKAAMVALIVGLAALAVAGILTAVLYKHWDFLCNQVA
jgi:hypothetical protein